MRKETKTVLTIVGVVMLVVFILSLVLIAGSIFLYLWVSTLATEELATVETWTYDAEIDATTNTLELTLLDGDDVNLSGYSIRIDGVRMFNDDEDIHSMIFVGDTIYLQDLDWDPLEFLTYNVQIINIGNNKLIWEADLMAQS